MARYLSVLTPSIPFCPLFHRLSVSLAPILSSSSASLLLLPCLPFYIQIHSPGCQTPLFPLFRKLSDALSRTTYMSTPSSPTEDFDSCLIHVSHTVTWDFLVCFPGGEPRTYFGARYTKRWVTNSFLKQKLSYIFRLHATYHASEEFWVIAWHSHFKGAMDLYLKQLF